jgi:hypothetical protein
MRLVVPGTVGSGKALAQDEIDGAAALVCQGVSHVFYRS